MQPINTHDRPELEENEAKRQRTLHEDQTEWVGYQLTRSKKFNNVDELFQRTQAKRFAQIPPPTN